MRFVAQSTMPAARIVLILVMTFMVANGMLKGHKLLLSTQADVGAPAKRLFYIQSKKSNLVLDTKGKERRRRTEVVLMPLDGSLSQKWSYVENAIVHELSGLSLAVSHLGKPKLNPLIIDVWDTGNDKKWHFEGEDIIRVLHWNYVLTDVGNTTAYAAARGRGNGQKFIKSNAKL